MLSALEVQLPRFKPHKNESGSYRLPASISVLLIAALACGMSGEIATVSATPTISPLPDCGATLPDPGKSCLLPNDYVLSQMPNSVWTALIYGDFSLQMSDGTQVTTFNELEKPILLPDGSIFQLDTKQQIIFSSPNK